MLSSLPSLLLPKKKCPPTRRFASISSSSCSAMNCWLIVAIILTLVIATIAPQALSAVLNKLLLMSLAAWCGYWLHRSAFIRPAALLDLIDFLNPKGAPFTEWDTTMVKIALASMYCRAAIMSAAMVAIALGI
jgi:Putative 2/3 transmembrane domain holin